MPADNPQSVMPPANPNKGFQLPPPTGERKQQPAVGAGEQKAIPGSPKVTTQVPVQPPKPPDTQTRDISIGIGILIGCMVIFLFAKKKYANWLVQNRKSPKSAGAGGLWLFVLLTCLAAAAIFPLLRSEIFLNAIFLGAVGGVALIALVFMVIKSK
ncbi:MAG: hypothetical protein D4R73_07610 [Deltaproteobacteria bacterium]|nr:MAG: hypothetical protein D4R73_07610 [Deltaproteobacteria bacterium]